MKCEVSKRKKQQDSFEGRVVNVVLARMRVCWVGTRIEMGQAWSAMGVQDRDVAGRERNRPVARIR
jgi:hypothetical protein